MTARAWRAAGILVLIWVLGAGANLLFTAHEVNVSQHRWCQTLDLLTAHAVARPADPRANPSRENAYIFYRDVTDLRHRFGCG